MKILIADDFPLIRQGVIQTLRNDGCCANFHEAGDGREVLDYIRENDYDLVLLDISMPGRNGIDVLKQIKSLRPRLPVLILTMYPEEQYAVRAMKAGAAGYVSKTQDPSVLVEAVNRVSLGKKFVSEKVAEHLADALGKNSIMPLHKRLSDREYEVFCGIASGQSVTEIADKMSLSVKTISTYRSRVLDKMKFKNNAALTHYAIKNKLVE